MEKAAEALTMSERLAKNGRAVTVLVVIVPASPPGQITWALKAQASWQGPGT